MMMTFVCLWLISIRSQRQFWNAYGFHLHAHNVQWSLFQTEEKPRKESLQNGFTGCPWWVVPLMFNLDGFLGDSLPNKLKNSVK